MEKYEIPETEKELAMTPEKRCDLYKRRTDAAHMHAKGETLRAHGIAEKLHDANAKIAEMEVKRGEVDGELAQVKLHNVELAATVERLQQNLDDLSAALHVSDHGQELIRQSKLQKAMQARADAEYAIALLTPEA